MGEHKKLKENILIYFIDKVAEATPKTEREREIL